MAVVTVIMPQRNETRNPGIHTTAASEDVAITSAELLAADGWTDERTDGTAATKRPSCGTEGAGRAVSFHIGDDPPTGDVSLRPARPLPRINVRVRAARKNGSCGNRAAPLLCAVSSSATYPDPGSRWMITGVMANAIYLSSCSSRGLRRDGCRDRDRGNGGIKRQRG